ncbi:PTS sugar transporter subunit IIA [Streptomonospora wellingtoniae]|uniref:Mannitol-specific phosphotransferase enzyme IIA component n=1 Tax=Streptomonospora wellingtoniae TaxID=3075544 RepID=A0ABU2KWL3_9ACTN|nr:PTS sugar transporter subunit IIA [Streptomonospora sp. DSM 45055]MDT0303611.1 PTS sugar transporter subunit IIA [Streptomonospora sp. DSM 45055]
MPTDLRIGPEAVWLGRTARDKAEAVDLCGRLLLRLDAVQAAYLPTMHERERSVPTYIGEGVAIPHGTDAARALVKRTALAFVQFPDGVDWDGHRAVVAIGIAAHGDEHTGVLAALARVLSDPAKAERLRQAEDAATVVELLSPVGTEPAS